MSTNQERQGKQLFKPVTLLGNGVRRNPYFALKDRYEMPVLTTWMGADLIGEDNPSFCGRPGTFGQRAANVIQQKADAVFCFGARMDNEQVSYDYSRYAPRAVKYVYDIDPFELRKFPEDGTWKVTSDISKMMEWYAEAVEKADPRWMRWSKALYKAMRPEIEGKPGGISVDPFYFISVLSEACRAEDVLAIGSSAFAPNSFLQAFKVKFGQRITVCATFGAMGMDIPMAIGACHVANQNTICVTGDGGFFLNMQELEVIRRERLPIKFFVYSNGGYGSIRAMQDLRFGRRVGCDADSGFTIPSLSKTADLFGIDYYMIPMLNEGDTLVENIVKVNKPIICEVMIDHSWVQWPKVMSSMDANGKMTPDAMEDMTPHLSAERLKELMEWDG